jgi:uncharacterized protein
MTEADARIVSAVARDLDVPPLKARAVADLLDEGATVPFIARYRKEATGGMDEVAIIALRDGVQRRRELEKRRKAVLESIASQGSLTEGLQKQILGGGYHGPPGGSVPSLQTPPGNPGRSCSQTRP